MTSNPTETLLSALNENALFHDSNLSFDLRGGVIWNPAKTRLCILSTDFLTGVYKGLVDEAGPGWHLILNRCGTLWGARLAKRLDRECSLLLGQRMGDMALEEFLGFFRNYFVFHGWGSLTLQVERAKENGLIEATLIDSVFTQIIEDPEQMADPMISGILASFIGYLSGRELTCVQTMCATKGSDISRFIIGTPERLKMAAALVTAGKKHEELVETL